MENVEKSCGILKSCFEIQLKQWLNTKMKGIKLEDLLKVEVILDNDDKKRGPKFNLRGLK